MKPFTRDLTIGSFGGDVLQLQQILEQLGFGDFIPTGIFGPKTREAVSKYQKARGIEPTAGYFGKITRTKMNAELNLNNRERLYDTAFSCLGTDASPNDIAPDEYGCAETVNAIHKKAFGFEIGGDVSTTRMYRALEMSPYFMRVDQPLRGDVIISPTGYGNGGLSNGHVGIVSDNNSIMSNSSYTGKFEHNFTMKSWRDRYEKIGGYPIVFFRRL